MIERAVTSTSEAGLYTERFQGSSEPYLKYIETHSISPRHNAFYVHSFFKRTYFVKAGKRLSRLLRHLQDPQRMFASKIDVHELQREAKEEEFLSELPSYYDLQFWQVLELVQSTDSDDELLLPTNGRYTIGFSLGQVIATQWKRNVSRIEAHKRNSSIWPKGTFILVPCEDMKAA